MQVSISCDDGFQSKLFISTNITGQDLFHEVCNLRRSLGHDHPLDHTPAFFTIGYSIYGRTIEYITSLVVLDQVLPAANAPAVASSSKAQKNPPFVFHIFGFASLKRNNVLLQLREFSSKLAVMSMSFSTAVEHYQCAQMGPPQALLPPPSSSSSSQALVPYPTNPEILNLITVDDISGKIGVFFAEIHQMFDLALSGEHLSVAQKSLLTKARASFLAGDLASVMGMLQMPTLEHFIAAPGASSSSSSSSVVVEAQPKKTAAQKAAEKQAAQPKQPAVPASPVKTAAKPVEAASPAPTAKQAKNAAKAQAANDSKPVIAATTPTTANSSQPEKAAAEPKAKGKQAAAAKKATEDAPAAVPAKADVVAVTPAVASPIAKGKAKAAVAAAQPAATSTTTTVATSSSSSAVPEKPLTKAEKAAAAKAAKKLATESAATTAQPSTTNAKAPAAAAKPAAPAKAAPAPAAQSTAPVAPVEADKARKTIALKEIPPKPTSLIQENIKKDDKMDVDDSGSSSDSSSSGSDSDSESGSGSSRGSRSRSGSSSSGSGSDSGSESSGSSSDSDSGSESGSESDDESDSVKSREILTVKNIPTTTNTTTPKVSEIVTQPLFADDMAMDVVEPVVKPSKVADQDSQETVLETPPKSSSSSFLTASNAHDSGSESDSSSSSSDSAGTSSSGSSSDGESSTDSEAENDKKAPMKTPSKKEEVAANPATANKALQNLLIKPQPFKTPSHFLPETQRKAIVAQQDISSATKGLIASKDHSDDSDAESTVEQAKPTATVAVPAVEPTAAVVPEESSKPSSTQSDDESTSANVTGRPPKRAASKVASAALNRPAAIKAPRSTIAAGIAAVEKAATESTTNAAAKGKAGVPPKKNNGSTLRALIKEVTNPLPGETPAKPVENAAAAAAPKPETKKPAPKRSISALSSGVASKEGDSAVTNGSKEPAKKAQKI